MHNRLITRGLSVAPSVMVASRASFASDVPEEGNSSRGLQPAAAGQRSPRFPSSGTAGLKTGALTFEDRCNHF